MVPLAVFPFFRFSDLAEGVEVLEYDRYLLHLSRLAQWGKAGTGEQVAQRLPLFHAGATVMINETWYQIPKE